MSHDNIHTYGSYATEAIACAEFDRLVEATELFHIEREVECAYIQPRRLTIRGNQRQYGRIDRILIPRVRLIDAGWKHGSIGVECKCSGKMLGPVLCQVMDYTRAVFRISNGSSIYLDQFFIWPLNAVPHNSDLSYLMTSHRIGEVFSTRWESLVFKLMGTGVIRCGLYGELKQVKPIRAGHKCGSRSFTEKVYTKPADETDAPTATDNK